MEQISGAVAKKIYVQEVPDGFENWVKILMRTQRELMSIVSMTQYHVSNTEKERFKFSESIINMLSQDDLASAIHEYTTLPDNKRFQNMH